MGTSARVESIVWSAGLLVLAASGLAACSREPPVVHELRVSIDAANNCVLDEEPVDCAGVAAAIKAKYPTSTPRVDICLAKETRFEAATEVMKSVEAAGFPVGTLDCASAAARG
jgi:biopolymer transport protein ExbD